MPKKNRNAITVIIVTALLFAFLITVAAVSGVKVFAFSFYIGF